MRLAQLHSLILSRTACVICRCPVYSGVKFEVVLGRVRRLFLNPVIPLSIFILMGCEVAYMGAFLCMPIFLTEAAGLSITDAAQILALRPAFGCVISLIMAKLMGGHTQQDPDSPDDQRQRCCFSYKCTVSNLTLTLAGCCVSVVGCTSKDVILCLLQVINRVPMSSIHVVVPDCCPFSTTRGCGRSV